MKPWNPKFYHFKRGVVGDEHEIDIPKYQKWKHGNVTINMSFQLLHDCIALRHTMAVHGLSVRKLSEISGLDRNAIERIESGNPSVTMLQVCAYTYHVKRSRDEFLIPSLATVVGRDAKKRRLSRLLKNMTK